MLAIAATRILLSFRLLETRIFEFSFITVPGFLPTAFTIDQCNYLDFKDKLSASQTRPVGSISNFNISGPDKEMRRLFSIVMCEIFLNIITESMSITG
jgi:hypothetical protein